VCDAIDARPREEGGGKKKKDVSGGKKKNADTCVPPRKEERAGYFRMRGEEKRPASISLREKAPFLRKPGKRGRNRPIRREGKRGDRGAPVLSEKSPVCLLPEVKKEPAKLEEKKKELCAGGQVRGRTTLGDRAKKKFCLVPQRGKEKRKRLLAAACRETQPTAALGRTPRGERGHWCAILHERKEKKRRKEEGIRHKKKKVIQGAIGERGFRQGPEKRKKGKANCWAQEAAPPRISPEAGNSLAAGKDRERFCVLGIKRAAPPMEKGKGEEIRGDRVKRSAASLSPFGEKKSGFSGREEGKEEGAYAYHAEGGRTAPLSMAAQKKKQFLPNPPGRKKRKKGGGMFLLRIEKKINRLQGPHARGEKRGPAEEKSWRADKTRRTPLGPRERKKKGRLRRLRKKRGKAGVVEKKNVEYSEAGD